MGRVAAIQMVSGTQVGPNLQVAARLIADAARQKAEVVFLPENFACLTPPDLVAIGKQERYADGPIRAFLSAQAIQWRIWIVGGTVPTVSTEDAAGLPLTKKVRSACFVYASDGQEVSRYDKIHLFDVEVADNTGTYLESATVDAGQRIAVVDTPVGRVGLSVCYDIRFAELYRLLFHQGAEILSVPAAFTEVTGAAHWEVLMRARAIENFCYVVGAAQGGEHESGRRTYGNSMVIDPWGRVKARLERGVGVVTAEIDLKELHEIRRKIPVAKQTRFKILEQPSQPMSE